MESTRLSQRGPSTAELSRRGWQALRLVASGMLLSWCVTARWPAPTPLVGWLAPSIDVAVLLGLFALFAPHAGWQLPRALTALGCALLLAIRLGRIADGICQQYLDRRFHVAADLTLVPEFARLSLSTLGPLRLTGVALAALCMLAVLWLLVAAALRVLARTLSLPRAGNWYLAVVMLMAAASALTPSASLFASPVAPRLMSEFELWLTARGLFDDPAHLAQRRRFAVRFQERQAQLSAAPLKPSATGNVDVHIVLVEAYGRTVQSTPAYAQFFANTYREFEERLARAGFSVCSDFVLATMVGGNSWLTHSTLESGAAMYDQSDYGLFMEQSEIVSLAKKFRAAGYRAVSVKPGTTRPSPQTRLYGFDREYTAPDLGYHGPTYAWAPMPDQFVLQRVAELELRNKTAPLFIEYALVSSHFPFNPHPDYVDDWASLGDGSIYLRQPPVQFGENQPELSSPVLGYLSSILYDLHTLSHFIARYVQGDALVLVLGDHQPIAPVAGQDLSRATPLHVISRRAELLQPFRERGCVPGMLGPSHEPQRAMQDLGMELLHAVSTEAAR